MACYSRQHSLKTAFLSAFTSFALASQGIAASMCGEDALLVFDGSGSMAGPTTAASGSTRIADAQHAMRLALPLVTPHRDVGLMVYGPGGDNGCGGISLAFGPRPDTASDIIEVVDEVRPSGLTPLAASIHQAAEVMNYREQPAVIVVVTDGFETCGGSPCTIAARLSEESAGLRIHVVGFNLPEETVGWMPRSITPDVQGARCMAENTGGLYVTVQTPSELVDALNTTLGCMMLVDQGPARQNPHA